MAAVYFTRIPWKPNKTEIMICFLLIQHISRRKDMLLRYFLFNFSRRFYVFVCFFFFGGGGVMRARSYGYASGCGFERYHWCKSEPREQVGLFA